MDHGPQTSRIIFSITHINLLGTFRKGTWSGTKTDPDFFLHFISKSHSQLSALSSSTSICIYSTSLLFYLQLSAPICTSYFLVTVHLFLSCSLHFTYTIFGSRSFQTLISYLYSYLYIWFCLTLLSVLYMLNHAIETTILYIALYLQ